MKIDKLFAKTMAFVSDAVIITDSQGIITYFNSVAQAFITGNPVHEKLGIIGRKLTEVFEFLNSATGKLIELPVRINEQLFAADILLISRSGEKIHFEQRVNSFIDDDN